MEEFTEESVSSTIFEDLGVDDGDDCLPLKKSFLLPLMFVPALVALENICVLLVMISHWETLSKRSINAYVSSMVTANFLLSLMIFYHFLNYYFGFESVDPTLWWAFRKGENKYLFSLIFCDRIMKNFFHYIWKFLIFLLTQSYLKSIELTI